ncbi:MAG: 5-(carboxyamino)imidazole ribonucleotide mutase [Kiritimatiellia bacterium]|nr:5-(carboxyamino)imidazole ribonucleotide mutase [Kiritimatiellia bacterium]
MKKTSQVAIVMGSFSDWPAIQSAAETLKRFDIPFEAHVMSAHRTPDEAAEFSRGAAERGLKVILAAAGSAAHLAGVLAAHTTLPVIGIPVQGGALNGLDALLSTVQMPAGIPVATVAVGSGGPPNAALLAVEILALSDERLRAALREHKESMRRKVQAADAELQAKVAALQEQK